MKVRLSLRAARDLAKIGESIARVNPDAARSIGAAIEATQKFIGEHPGIGRLQKGRGIR